MSTQSIESTQDNPGQTVAVRRRLPPAPSYMVQRLALKLASDKKTHARAALRDAGYASSERYVAQLLAARSRIRSRRQNRRAEDARERLGHTPVRSLSAQRRAPVLLPAGTPMQRLTLVRRDAVRDAAYEVLRHGAAGGHGFHVNVARDASQVGYRVIVSSNRDTYGGQFKGWLAREDHHRVCVPADWRLRVLRRGLAHLGGMLTLDAHRLQAPDGIQLYTATWARQGRGYDVIVERGYIGIVEGEHFHAETPEQAVNGAQRKARAAGRERKSPFEPLSASVEEFIKRYRKIPAMVEISDAEETGSCDYGIRSWCAAVGLDYDAGDAPLSEVLDGFKLRPQVEVRRAVLFAVRRYSADKRRERRRLAESSGTPAVRTA